MSRPGPTAGITMVELAVAMALVMLLAGVAVPTLQQQQLKGRRTDAVDALSRVQFLQEQYRANNGLYAPTLTQLTGAGARSAQGLYDVALGAVGPNGYMVAARAHAGSGQERDRDCLELTLSVHEGIASHGPNPRCWNR